VPALEEIAQVRVWFVGIPVAPFEGEGFEGVAGVAQDVVNLQAGDHVPAPAGFTPATFQ
jgi:hypothetical protein